ncbi:hypothetical protein BC941DRAFT_466114 [Chlamydoabsidia padenii]|nr:hypothetical protein BC941DRAFT_466114 [Chlamydoabsidia padenii]
MHNPLKRQSSVDDLNDPSHNTKRIKHLFNDALSPYSYTDYQSINGSHLPPSPPIVVDTPLPSLPSPLSAASADSIPTLKRFTITTRHRYQDQSPSYNNNHSTSDYANINQILYEAHIRRNRDTMDTNMMDYNEDDPANYYNQANAVLRQAFLQRHPSPP